MSVSDDQQVSPGDMQLLPRQANLPQRCGLHRAAAIWDVQIAEIVATAGAETYLRRQK